MCFLFIPIMRHRKDTMADTTTERKELAEDIAALIADTVMHTPDRLRTRVVDITHNPASGIMGSGFVAVTADGRQYAVMVYNFVEEREQAELMAHVLKHGMAPWKPLASGQIVWASQCITCGRVAMVYRDGRVSGPALKDACYISPKLDPEVREL
jgi:hypothetical protein